MRIFSYLGIVLLILFPAFIYAQSGTTVVGTVLDDSSSPLEGVTVEVLNLSDSSLVKASFTNKEGLFRFADLEGNRNYHFRFSHIGFENHVLANFQVKAGENNTMLVRMRAAESSSLEDVIVIGYGTKQRVNLTGAVSQVNGDDFRDRPVTNISTMLQGAIPNLNINFGGGMPGQMGSLNVRGATSISGSSVSNGSPLVLIDGIPGTLDRMSPEEVETITVLKDASSAAIYGARAAFGVVLVTTKSGKSGKTVFRYNNSFGWATPTVSTDFITTGYDWMKLNDQALAHVGGYSGYTESDYAELYARRNDKTEDPSRPWVTIQNRNGRDQYVYYGNYDWYDIMFTKWQGNQNHNLSFSGGSDKVTYMVNANMKRMDGIMRVQDDNYKSHNVRTKLTAELTPWLKFSNNINFYNSTYDYFGRTGGGNANFVHINVHASPAYAPFNPDGTASYRTGLNNYDIGDGIFAMLLDGKTRGAERKYELKQISELVFTPLKNLRITANYSYNMYTDPSFYRQSPATFSLEPGIEEITPKYSVNKLSEDQQFNQVHVVNVYGNYNFKLGRSHNFNLVAGYNQEMHKSKKITAERFDISSEDLNDLNLGTGDQIVLGGSSAFSVQGYFYRMSYDYKSKYLFEANGRYDGSSRFPAGQRFGFFPSFSAGWRLSEEAFYAPMKDIINDFKIRGSVGQLGNQAVSSAYPYVLSMQPGTMSYLIQDERLKYYSSPNPVSGDLTWEKVTSYNVGIDLMLLRNRLSVSYDQFIRTTRDMLGAGVKLPNVYGAPQPLVNVADLETKGFEITIQWNDNIDLAGKPLRYRAGVVLSDNSTVITKINNPTAATSSLYEGKNVGEIWGYITNGYFRTDAEAKTYPIDQTWLNRVRIDNNIPIRAGDLRWVDLDGDGKISAGENTIYNPGDQRVIGNTTPRYRFGITGGLNWNNLDMSFFFQGIGKMNWYPGSNADRFWGPYSRPYFSFLPKDFPDMVWSPENPDAYFPSLVAYVALNANNELRATNNKYLQDLAYIRLKNLNIGYTLPSSITRRYKIDRLRVFVSGENVFTSTKLNTKYIDPEQAMANNDARVYPFVKTYSFGIDLSF